MVDSPSGGALGKAPRWDLAGTEGCGGGNRVLAPVLMFPGYMSIYRRKGRSGELRGAHEGGGRAEGGQARLPASRPPR